MTPALVFMLGMLAGASAVLCAACCRVGARTLPTAQPTPGERPAAARFHIVGCRCLGCATAADLYDIRQLPEVAK